MKKNKSVMIISVLLLIAALVGSLWLDDVIGSKISNIVTIITAIIGAVALFVQFKKDKEINQASFVLDFVKEFRSFEGYDALTDELEAFRKKRRKTIKFEEHYTAIVSYLQWIETLASLVKSGVMEISMIDDLLSYNVFIILNNKIIQDKELLPCKEFYVGTFNLYQQWYDYKKKANLPIMMEETSLNKAEGFYDVVHLPQKKEKNKKAN